MSHHLLTPGPVELPQDVLNAGARSLISHRCPEFSSLFGSIESRLKSLLRTGEPVVILPSSGTGALECLAANFCTPETTCLSLSCGSFGKRFREIVQRYGAKTVNVDVTPGEALSPETAVRALTEHPEYSVVLLTQNETSTGVTNPIAEIAAAIPMENRPLIFVDGVSAVGAMPCFPEEWNLDAVATASQKGLMTAPGLGLIWISRRAAERLASFKCPSYFFDLKLHLAQLAGPQFANPFTPPVSLYYELDAALGKILARGADRWFADRRRVARAFAAGLEALGFELLVKDRSRRSAGVTAFGLPDGASIEELRRCLRSMDVEIAGGQDGLKGKVLRAAHYVEWSWPELCLVLGALYGALGGGAGGGDCLAAAWHEWNKGE